MSRVNGKAPPRQMRRIKMSLPMPDGTTVHGDAGANLVGKKTKLKDMEGNEHTVTILGAEPDKEGTAMLVTLDVPEAVAQRVGVVKNL